MIDDLQNGASMAPASPTINLLVLRSPDMHRAVKFYEALGLVFTLHSHGKGPEHYASTAGGFTFEIYPLTSGQSPTVSTRLGFSVESMELLLPRLTDLGATILTAPAHSEWGRRAVVKDLDGHVVELVTALK